MVVLITRDYGGIVQIDGEAKEVDLTGLAADIQTVLWDSERGGLVQWVQGTMDSVSERDIEAEHAAYDLAIQQNKEPPTEMLYHSREIFRPNLALTDFSDYQVFVDRFNE